MRSRLPLGVGVGVAAALCALVWSHARWLGALPTLYLTVVSVSTACTLWWAVRFQLSGLPRTGRYTAVVVAVAGLQALLVVALTLTHGTPPPPTAAQRAAELFGVGTVDEPRVPVLVVGHRPTLDDAAGLPPPLNLGIGPTVAPAPSGGLIAIPVQKVQLTGPTAKLLVHADMTCRLRGAVIGPAANDAPPGPRGSGPVAVLVVVEPTEHTDDRPAGPAGRCGPDGVFNSYSVLDVIVRGPALTELIDVAGGPAVRVG